MLGQPRGSVEEQVEVARGDEFIWPLEAREGDARGRRDPGRVAAELVHEVDEPGIGAGANDFSHCDLAARIGRTVVSGKDNTMSEAAKRGKNPSRMSAPACFRISAAPGPHAGSPWDRQVLPVCPHVPRSEGSAESRA